MTKASLSTLSYILMTSSSPLLKINPINADFPLFNDITYIKQEINDSWIDDYVQFVDDLIHTKGMYPIFQNQFFNGILNNANSDEVSTTSVSHRDMKYATSVSIFYDETQNPNLSEIAIQNILHDWWIDYGLEQQFTSINNVKECVNISDSWQYYFDSKIIFDELRQIKTNIDPKNIFYSIHTIRPFDDHLQSTIQSENNFYFGSNQSISIFITVCVFILTCFGFVCLVIQANQNKVKIVNSALPSPKLNDKYEHSEHITLCQININNSEERKSESINACKPMEIEQPNIENIDFSTAKNSKYVGRSRKMKLNMTITIIITSIIMWLSKLYFGFNIYNCIALMVTIDYLYFIFTIFFIISTAKYLHYVSADMIGIYGYRVFSIPSALTSNDKNECIKSISLLSAIPGSLTHSTFLAGCSMSYVINLTAILMKYDEWKAINIISTTKWISLYLFFIANVGQLMIALWNVEENILSNVCHYTGVTGFMIIGPIAFILNQNASLISVGLFAIEMFLLIIYITISLLSSQKYDDPKLVHKTSYICILVELSSTTVTMMIYALFVWCMDDNRILTF